MTRKAVQMVKVGEGDDRIESWNEGFDGPLDEIKWILEQSETHDLPIDWERVTRGLKTFEGLDECDAECVHELFDFIPGAEQGSKHWGGDSPGQSGYYIEVLVPKRTMKSALQSFRRLSDRLCQFWAKSGNEARAEHLQAEAAREAAALEAERDRIAAEREAEKECNRALEAKRLADDAQRKHLARVADGVERIEIAIESQARSGERFFECMELGILIESGIRLYVITAQRGFHKSPYCRLHDLRLVRDVLTRLGDVRLEIVEVAETFPEEAIELMPIGYVDRNYRVTRHHGWNQSVTVLEAASQTSLVQKVRAEYIQWKSERSKFEDTQSEK